MAHKATLKKEAADAQSRAFLSENDFELFLRGARLRDAVHMAHGDPDAFGLVTQASLRRVRGECCVWWGVVRLRAKSQAKALNPGRWDRLKRAAWNLRADLRRAGNVERAVRVVRTVIPCNRDLLSGLPSRLRFWETADE